AGRGPRGGQHAGEPVLRGPGGAAGRGGRADGGVHARPALRARVPADVAGPLGARVPAARDRPAGPVRALGDRGGRQPAGGAGAPPRRGPGGWRPGPLWGAPRAGWAPGGRAGGAPAFAGPLVGVRGEPLSFLAGNAFKLLAPRAHLPRVTVGRLVLRRESWT